MPFASLGLQKPLCLALAKLNFISPTPVQSQAIPAILQGRDVWASAPTGSGKTGAYLLPLLQGLHGRPDSSSGRVRTLILTPTRELAAQVEQEIHRYSGSFEAQTKTCLCVGGVSINPQMMHLRGGADIVVATPGRLLDLVASNAADLSAVEVLVLDEADRMLSLGFAAELDELLSKLPSNSQKLLFSATFPREVQGLATALLHKPTRVSAESEEALIPETITERAISVDSKRRTKLLLHLIETEKWAKVLVFVASGERAHQLSAELKNTGLDVGLLHGRLKQQVRTDAIQDFQNGYSQILVATDLAARGLDVSELTAVVNYDLPRSPIDYIHRIGRTGRAGQAGVSVTFISAATEAQYRVIEKSRKFCIIREKIAGFVPVDVAPAERRSDQTGGIKGTRKSKKDKLREAAARTVQPDNLVSSEQPPKQEHKDT